MKCKVWRNSAVGSRAFPGQNPADGECGRPAYARISEGGGNVGRICCKDCADAYVEHYGGRVMERFGPTEEEVAEAIASILRTAR